MLNPAGPLGRRIIARQADKSHFIRLKALTTCWFCGRTRPCA